MLTNKDYARFIRIALENKEVKENKYFYIARHNNKILACATGLLLIGWRGIKNAQELLNKTDLKILTAKDIGIDSILFAKIENLHLNYGMSASKIADLLESESLDSFYENNYENRYKKNNAESRT